MALVVSPPTVWRDPNLVRELSSDNNGAVAAAAGVGGGGVKMTTTSSLAGQAASSSRMTPEIPASIPHSTLVDTSINSDTIVKDENGQDISCVVCGDKSSGKHYGQFTCEGKKSGNYTAICKVFKGLFLFYR